MVQDGFFGFWNGRFDYTPSTRFLYGSNAFIFNIGQKDVENGPYSRVGDSRWNQYIDKNLNQGDKFYFGISFDNTKVIEENKIGISILIVINDEIWKETNWFSKSVFDEFADNVENLKYIEIGRSAFGSPEAQAYFIGSCYAIKLYNVGLTAEELSQSYEVMKEFYESPI